jgi:hypothetical protein
LANQVSMIPWIYPFYYHDYLYISSTITDRNRPINSLVLNLVPSDSYANLQAENSKWLYWSAKHAERARVGLIQLIYQCCKLKKYVYSRCKNRLGHVALLLSVQWWVTIELNILFEEFIDV